MNDQPSPTTLALAESIVSTQRNIGLAVALRERGDSRLWDALQSRKWLLALHLLGGV